jgi:hypothetical protein
MSARLRPVVLSALLGTAAACGALKKGGGPPPEPSFVVFTNQASDQAAVYARRAGGTDVIRMGSVSPGRTETLRVPPTLSRDGNLVVVTRLLARRGVATSGEISLRPGDRVSRCRRRRTCSPCSRSRRASPDAARRAGA